MNQQTCALNPHNGALFTDGEWVDATSNEWLDVENPATGAIVTRVQVASAADVDRAVSAARRSHDDGVWSRATPLERIEVLTRFADIMEQRRSELVEMNITECGSVGWFADLGQVGGAIAHLRSTIEAMRTFAWESPTRPHLGNGVGQGLVRRESYGVAALISAYNFPLWLNMTKVAPALAAGCSAVLKPASQTPLEGLVLGQIAEEAGIPAGVFNVIVGGSAAGQALTTHPDVDIVSFTGSQSVGTEVYLQGARSLKKVVLELGGKSANIITEDADIDAAVQQIVTHTIIQAGQGCSLLMRTLVHNSIKDRVVEQVAAAMRSLAIGDPSDPSNQIGPLISAAQRETVENYIAAGVAEGAKVVTGGKRPSHLKDGYYIEPTLFTDVDNSMKIARDEIFGPVNVVIGFDTDEEAIAIANDSPYGLSGAVNSADVSRAYAIGNKLRTGQVIINGGGGQFPDISLPFGGYKASGIGREYGEWGLDEYLQTKSVGWAVGR